jgi:hypothetical protein
MSESWRPCVCEVDFDRVNGAALTRSHELIPALLPGGVTSGTQYVIPRQKDRRLLSIFLDSGKWSDFEVVAHGDDLVDITQRDTARLIAVVLDVEWRAASDFGEAKERGQ